jgi:hypothetical protein
MTNLITGVVIVGLFISYAPQVRLLLCLALECQNADIGAVSMVALPNNFS